MYRVYKYEMRISDNRWCTRERFDTAPFCCVVDECQTSTRDKLEHGVVLLCSMRRNLYRTKSIRGLFAPHSNWKAAVASIWRYRARAQCQMHRRSRIATPTKVTVRVESPFHQVRRTFPLHPLARVSHHSSIRDIEWVPNLGRTSVHKRASPLITTPVCSQPHLSEPRTTPEAYPEYPRYLPRGASHSWTLQYVYMFSYYFLHTI